MIEYIGFTLFVIIYLIGAICSFFISRKMFIFGLKEIETRGDIYLICLLAICSWAGILTSIITFLICDETQLKEK